MDLLFIHMACAAGQDDLVASCYNLLNGLNAFFLTVHGPKLKLQVSPF